MMRTLLLSFIFIPVALFAGNTASDSKAVAKYRNHCLEKTQRPLGVAQKICQCVIEGFKESGLSDDDFDFLRTLKPLSPEEATKVSNVTEQRAVLENLDFQVHVACYEKEEKANHGPGKPSADPYQ